MIDFKIILYRMKHVRQLSYSAPQTIVEWSIPAQMLCASVEDGAIEGLEIEDLVFGEEGEI